MPEIIPGTIEEYLLILQACATSDALFAAFAAEMRAEGYDNIIFARMAPGENLAPREVPFVNAPKTLTKAYLHNRMWEHDPVLAATQGAAVPFTWIDLMTRQPHSENARGVMETRRQHGVQGGFTMPFHGPAGYWDAVNISMRDQKLLDPDRIAIINLKTYATLQRYTVLTMGSKATGPWTGLSQGPIMKTREPAPHHPQHGEGVGVIADQECRALALVDIASRRYSAGFLKLNRQVPDIVGQNILDHFVDRGLIEEEPDDYRFHYVFRPSPVGQSHLRLCPCVSTWRDEVLDRYVEKHERPED